MKLKLSFGLSATILFSLTCFGQSDLTIKKKTFMKVPGMPAMPMGMGNLFPDRKSLDYMLGMMLSPPKMGAQPDPTKRTPAENELTSAIASSSKMKDEFTFDFQLLGPGGAVAFQKSGKAKLGFPGEDVLSPPIRETASAILMKIGR